MVPSLRLAYLCLTAAVPRSHRFTTGSSQQPSTALSRAALGSVASRSLSMSSLPDSSVGPVEIGQEHKKHPHEDDLNEDSVFWRTRLEISNAKSRKIRGSNFVQLSTVDAVSSDPRCRCVVLRGFVHVPTDHVYYVASPDTVQNLSCILQMCTDRRSQKVVAERRTAELLWWFPKTSEQYRIRGELLLVGGGDFERDDDPVLATARKQLWGNLSDTARESFVDPRTPGAAYEPPTDVVAATRGRTLDGKVISPPDDFLLMLLIPNQCDYLRLTHMYRQVDQVSETGWTLQRVNP